MAENCRRFEYRLRFPDGDACAIAVVIDGETLTCSEPAPADREWTRLACHRCPHCPLAAADAALCPLAARLDPVVAMLGSVLSHQEVSAEIVAAERTISATTTAQAVAGSIVGLISATSGCPHTAFLRPLAWFHQPFAGEEETIFRVVSAWFLRQYFAGAEAGPAGWNIDGLRSAYAALHTVNVHLAKRLRLASSQDAAVNAVVRLDMFTKAVPDEVEEILGHLRGRM